ncbi:hypothetical protein [Winogradskyella sediminis]|uniref:hypothetical protein n=1 Tax=Winogradskyella sediminis TaxID=1382466 RepID=UPI003AA8502F
MGLLNIVVKDHRKKYYSRMHDLREEVELLICENINKMNKIEEMYLQSIQSIDRTTEMTELDKDGWSEDRGLYDRLVFEYQEKTGELMQRWKKN